MNSLKSILPLLRKSYDTDNTDCNDTFSYNYSEAIEKRARIEKNNSIYNSLINEPIYLKNKDNIDKKQSYVNIENESFTKETKELSTLSEEKYYNVLWRKQTTKKNKTWQGDGILLSFKNMYFLKDLEGNNLAKCHHKSSTLSIGDQLKIGDKEIESILTKDYLSEEPLIQLSKEPETSSVPHIPIKKFKTPLLPSDTMNIQLSKLPQSRHDPNEPGALVLPRPKIQNSEKKNIQIIDVVVDPLLSKHLRPHQREGVKFLYECVMKMKEFEGQGAILADEMGLGKSLQIIALLWTLLSFPYYGFKSIIKRALIVCPVTLINNWKREFQKWIGGNERIGLFIADSNTNIKSFSVGNVYSVMIIGYERLRNVCNELKDADIDIVICDEAQAIKSLKTRRRIILSGTPIQNGKFNCYSLINIELYLDLTEFYVMVDFVNPGLLENYTTFKKEFEAPIIKSRQMGCIKKDKEKGRVRSEQLASLTKMFVLRRTSEILDGYFPPTIEYIVFCKPTVLQVDIYHELINMSLPNLNTENINMGAHLQALTYLKKVCNSPALLFQKKNFDMELNSFYANIKHKFSSKLQNNSGKLLVFDKFLDALKVTNEKIVIVSHYTQTLQILENLLISKSLPYLRLDGQTANTKRQEYVDKFNTSDADEIFAFLLSAKSGGYGLNLIGASRLILFDIDWNPSVDLQTMARIRRDGQKKKTYVYRFLIAGMIDEKIYQRQITKQALSDTFIDSKTSVKKDFFTQEELKSLFFYQDTSCQTHQLLGCECQGDGLNIKNTNHKEISDDEVDLGGWIKSSEVLESELNYTKKKYLYSINKYSHIEISKNNDHYNIIEDSVLRKISQENNEIDKGVSPPQYCMNKALNSLGIVYGGHIKIE
ncbi:hypothetical protein PCANB_001671 [Pneumocystis canis]|nr:hypothetical protein PCANB_001671 [Pneumocystis canis]